MSIELLPDPETYPKNTWVKIEDQRPPFDLFILVCTIDNLCLYAFRRSNKYYCVAPTPAGPSYACIEEAEIKLWFAAEDPPGINVNIPDPEPLIETIQGNN